MNPVLFRHTVPLGDYAIPFESLIPETIDGFLPCQEKNSAKAAW